MKKTALLLPLAFAAMVSCNNTNTENTNTTKTDSTTVVTTEPAKETTPPPPPMDSAAQMKAWQENMTPGEMHKMLASTEGKWTAEMTSWQDPAKPPMKSTLTVDNKMILGGRYQVAVHKGTMMGQPFEGIATTGYDNTKKVFSSTWVDNMSTGQMFMEGPMDAATKTVTFKGTMMDYTTGKDTKYTQIMKYTDDKNQTMEMYYAGPDGKEIKSMEIKYTRK